MKRIVTIVIASMLTALVGNAQKQPGKAPHNDSAWQLRVAKDHRTLQTADGKPFFWLGDTGWLLAHKLDRNDISRYLADCQQNGFNVVQVQLISDREPNWQTVDHIVSEARRHNIYIGMVAVWGSQLKNGKMTARRAAEYGRFLASRYGHAPNIVWIMGGDIQGDLHTDVWDSLATNIKRTDSSHLMTYHPRGRTFSAKWFADRQWLDFNMFQSGHRRYNQRMGDKHYPIAEGTEEDNFQYVDSCRRYNPQKPVLDGEPSYENIPQGLHNPDEPRWTDSDVRRYAYWSVFAGSCGHTYGNNEIMQFIGTDEPNGAYGADGTRKTWQQALADPGRTQMKHLARLMSLFPPATLQPAQQLASPQGQGHQRVAVCQGKGVVLAYNYASPQFSIDLSQTTVRHPHLWLFSPQTGQISYQGPIGKKHPVFTRQPTADSQQPDQVLIIADPAQNKAARQLPRKR